MPRRPTTDDDQESVIEDLADGAQLLRLGFQAAGDGVLDDDDDPEGGNGTVLMAAATSASSDLEAWDGPAALFERTTPLLSQPEDSELTDDPVRMYLREIGRVGLLTAQDERVLARAMELQRRLDGIRASCKTADGKQPPAADVCYKVMSLLAPQHEVAEALGRYAGAPPRMTLRYLVGDPDLRDLIDGPHKEELVRFVSDALNCGSEDAQERLVELSVISALVPLDVVEAFEEDPAIEDIGGLIAEDGFMQRARVYEFLFSSHFARIHNEGERSERDRKSVV